jgi:hypothetical protein
MRKSRTVRGDIRRGNNGHSKDKLDLYSAPQHTESVSSNSPQKELDFKPALSGLFFVQKKLVAVSSSRHGSVIRPSPALPRIPLALFSCQQDIYDQAPRRRQLQYFGQ